MPGMAHPPPYGQGPHGPPPYQHHQGGYRRRDGAGAIAGVIHLVTGVIVAIFVLHIIFVVFDANQANGFVSGIYDVAKALVLGLGDVFTPDDARIGVVLNYGLAALLYLIVGQVIVRMLRR